jgi:hypothetical protein
MMMMKKKKKKVMKKKVVNAHEDVNSNGNAKKEKG